jgi:hypothetical protein
MSDYDSPWKDVIEIFFPQFIDFFLPKAYNHIDWEKGYTFLDKELKKITRDAREGKRVVDRLVRVALLDGRAGIIFIHIEIQNDTDPDFERRMYIYNFRIFDRYACPVVSMAVLGDENRGWRPSQFGYALFGFETRIKFPAVKLIDYLDHWEDLEQSPNPFAMVVMAHLQAKLTAKNRESRFRWKTTLTRMLYAKGYNKKAIIGLFRFIDWVIDLDDELEQKYTNVLEEIEEDSKMPYVSSVERVYDKRYREKYQKEYREKYQKESGEKARLESANMLLVVLEGKFGNIPNQAKDQIQSADAGQLRHWARELHTVDSLNELLSTSRA